MKIRNVIATLGAVAFVCLSQIGGVQADPSQGSDLTAVPISGPAQTMICGGEGNAADDYAGIIASAPEYGMVDLKVSDVDGQKWLNTYDAMNGGDLAGQSIMMFRTSERTGVLLTLGGKACFFKLDNADFDAVADKAFGKGA